jgi:hypothetical protein
VVAKIIKDFGIVRGKLSSGHIVIKNDKNIFHNPLYFKNKPLILQSDLER